MNYEIGMVGLGVMGHNLLLNMSDHGYRVSGYDKDIDKVKNLTEAAQTREIFGTTDIKQFIASLRQPRAVMMLVPAGAAVDSVIKDLLPHLQAGDLIIDAGNSHFKDTDIRTARLAQHEIQFLGVGISGGEAGARHGPCIMPGGEKKSYERVQPVFEAVAAKVNNTACVRYLGPGSSGHFVKMVHNGIEYAIMQLIAETYDLMKHGLNFNDEQLHQTFKEWNQGELNSYLIEITSQIFTIKDDKTQQPLIDLILDVARQNGTGMWTSQSGMEIQVPVPTIDIAVSMRDLSVFVKERQQVGEIYHKAVAAKIIDQQSFVTQLGHALYSGMLIAYAQGMALLAGASVHYHYNLDLATIAEIWRGGCIIRAALLDDIRTAYQTNPALANILLDSKLSQELIARQESLRHIISQSLSLCIPTPALMSALSYLDAFSSAKSPANLIQAQRDYFGAHTYERIDNTGFFHTEWEKS